MRLKAHWLGRLFSYGPRYTKGKIDGFHIVAVADDRTERGRVVDITLTDATVRNLMAAMTKYMNRDRSNDADPIDSDRRAEGD